MIRAKCLECYNRAEYADLSPSTACVQCGVVGRLAPLVVVHVPDQARESSYAPKERE